MRAVVTAILLAVVGSSPAIWAKSPGSVAIKVDIKDWKLANGLRVIFVRKGSIPVVTVQLWYHTGSKNEHPGIRGLAHMFEHMMFKGSTHVLPEKHAQMMAALGGECNAFTSQDVTAYHDTLPSQYLRFAMQMEAERMQHLLLTKKTITSEREVVKEEKRMRLENSPIGRALEAMYALAYTKHPYAWTPAGDISDLNRIGEKEAAMFYRTYYAPQNASLIVVGDVSEEEVRGAAEEAFGHLPRGNDPPTVTVVEPPQTALREKIGDWPTQLNVVLGAYHMPAATHPDIPALQVLAAILSAGKSSRLYQALVRKEKIALEAGGFPDVMEDPGILIIYAVGLPTHPTQKMKVALLREIERVKDANVSVKELDKVKNQLATRFLSRLETLGGLAYQIGESTYVRSDPRAFLQDVDRYDQVTVKDIRRVAQTYLGSANLSLILMEK